MAYVHDRFLDSEERYEIFVVKAAERPHLVHWSGACSNDSDGTTCEKVESANADEHGEGHDDHEEKKMDDAIIQAPLSPTDELSSPNPPPPLTDGSDLPGWRCQRIAPCMNSKGAERHVDIESPLEGTLNIGAGSTLMRWESQFPFISTTLCERNSCDVDRNDKCWWYSAKRRFDLDPLEDRAAPIIDHVDAARLVSYDSTNSTDSKNGQRKITLFCREYEVKSRPVKVVGATKGWSAMPSYKRCEDAEKHHQQQQLDNEIEIKNNWIDVGGMSTLLSGGGKGGWTFANLLSRFGNVSFRFSDTHGEMMSLQTYAKYITNPEGLSDDSPLGIYDSEFGDEDSPTNVLLEEYSVPKCFSPDLFDYVEDGATAANVAPKESAELEDEEEEEDDATHIPRPPYRWVLIGPERSGTGMHVDPLWTNAWVTVLQGKKRWLLFPPDTPYAEIGMIDDQPQIPSSIWFRDFYDKVTSPSWPEEYKPVEVLQFPGETVYVPAGWPHLVLNLELTVAVTHNYASQHGPFFERMWKEVANDEPDFALGWYSGLWKAGRDDLACKAPADIMSNR